MPISEYLWWLGLYLGCKVCTIKINHFWQLLVCYWAILKLIPKLQAFPFSSMPRVDPRVRKSNKSKFAVLLYLLLRWRLHARKAHVWFRKALCWFFIVFPEWKPQFPSKCTRDLGAHQHRGDDADLPAYVMYPDVWNLFVAWYKGHQGPQGEDGDLN